MSRTTRNSLIVKANGKYDWGQQYVYSYHCGGSQSKKATTSGAKCKDDNLFGFELEVTLGREHNSHSCGWSREKHTAMATAISNMCKIENMFKYEQDCSIGNGFEIISSPITLREAKRSIPFESICKALEANGYVSEKYGLCGLHVHISRCQFGANQSRQNTRIDKILYFIRKNIEDFKQLSRRLNFEYCDFGLISRYEASKNGVAKFREDYSRYNNHHCFINFGNPHTIEFRFFRGTTNAKKLVASIEFLINLVRQMQYVSFEDIDNNNLELIFKNQPQNVIEYLFKARHCFGY